MDHHRAGLDGPRPYPMRIAEHFEQHLGPIARGWSNPSRPDLMAVCFDDRPAEGVRTYATLGLSSHLIAMPTGRAVRMELIVCLDERYAGDAVPSFLLSLAETIVSRHEALVRGEFIGPSVPLIQSVRACGVYVAAPVLFEEAFGQCDDAEDPIVIAWLVPLMAEECAYIASAGWERFEELLDEAAPDLFDLDRPSIIG